MRNFIKSKPLFLFLLPVFFVLHGFSAYYDLVPVKDAFLLVLVYIAAAWLLAWLFWFLYRDLKKAALTALLIMSFHFFFGSIHDFLKDVFNGAFITRYSFLLPAGFLFFLVMIILLKKKKSSFTKLFTYINVLFLLLLTGEAVWLAGKIAGKKENPLLNSDNVSFSRCDSCKKPDIYLVILDEYAGNSELKAICNFDNGPFENDLRKRGFHVINESTSNYNITHYSIASTLHMDYLELNRKATEQENYKYTTGVMSQSRVKKFLSGHGYRFYNLPFFDSPGMPAQHQDNFLPAKTKLITSQTFLSRLFNDIIFNIASGKFRFRPLLKKYIYGVKNDNEKILRLTRDFTASQTVMPKFVFTHLMMPHYPYYFDSAGNPKPLETLFETQPSDINSYTGYIHYCNKQILQLVDDLLTASTEPPVIILLGDHGFRHFKRKVDPLYYFMNLNAVYLPGKNYNMFYDSMSNVNLFRVIFNTQFNQGFPTLKDSTILLEQYTYGDYKTD